MGSLPKYLVVYKNTNKRGLVWFNDQIPFTI